MDIQGDGSRVNPTSIVARIELDAISAYPAQTLHERERVARVMASMSATLMRLQRGYEKELTRFVTPIAEKRAER